MQGGRQPPSQGPGGSGNGRQPYYHGYGHQPQRPGPGRPMPGQMMPAPSSSFAKPMLTASHKSRQLSPGLPHEYEQPHSASSALPAVVPQSGPPQQSGINQAAPYSRPSAVQPHQMMSSSTYQGSAGQSRSKSSPRGGTIDEQLHQPFNLSNKQQPENGAGSGPGGSQSAAQPSSGAHQPPYSSQHFYANGNGAPQFGGPVVPSRFPGGAMQPPMGYHHHGQQGPPHYPPSYQAMMQAPKIAVAPFTNEEERRDYYQKQALKEVPPFSTLNADVIPKDDFVTSVEKHIPKIDPDLIKDIWRTIGLQSSDERVFKVASAMMEIQMLKIITELKSVNASVAQSKDANVRPNHVSFEDLSKTMEEFDVVIRRPQFMEEKQATQTARPGQSYSSMHSEPQKRFHHGGGDGMASRMSAPINGRAAN